MESSVTFPNAQPSTEKKQAAAKLIDAAKTQIAEKKFNSNDLAKLFGQTLDVSPENIAKSEMLEKTIVVHARIIKPDLCPSIKDDTIAKIDGNAHYTVTVSADQTTLLMAIAYLTLSRRQMAEVALTYQTIYGESILFGIKGDDKDNYRGLYFNLSFFVSNVLPVLNRLQAVPSGVSLRNMVIERWNGCSMPNEIEHAIKRIYKDDITSCVFRHGQIYLSPIARLMPQYEQLQTELKKLIDAEKTAGDARLAEIKKLQEASKIAPTVPTAHGDAIALVHAPQALFNRNNQASMPINRSSEYSAPNPSCCIS